MSPSGMHFPPTPGHGSCLGAPLGGLWGAAPHGSPPSPSALMLPTQEGADEGDKEGTQSRANLDYLGQM